MLRGELFPLHVFNRCGVGFLYPPLGTSGLELDLRDRAVIVGIDHLKIDDERNGLVLVEGIAA